MEKEKADGKRSAERYESLMLACAAVLRMECYLLVALPLNIPTFLASAIPEMRKSSPDGDVQLKAKPGPTC